MKRCPAKASSTGGASWTVGSAACLALLAGDARAGTRVLCEASVNGGAYTAHATANPGDRVLVQVRARYYGPESVVGLAGVSFIASVAGFGDDALLDWSGRRVGPFEPPQENPPPDQWLGRVPPYNSAAMTTIPSTTLVGGVLTILGSGTGGVLACGQGSPALSGTRYDASEVPVLFRFGFIAGGAGRTLDVRIHSILNGTGRWYRSLTTVSGDAINVAVDENLGSTITIVPSTAAWAVFAIGGVGRRRPPALRTQACSAAAR